MRRNCRRHVNPILASLLMGFRVQIPRMIEGHGMRVLALASQKGGSGKTTLVRVILPSRRERAGAGPVVLIDIDPQGSLADWWNERESAEMPAFAQTTVARLSADLEVSAPAGFQARDHRYAAGDHDGDPERHPGRRTDRHPDAAEPARSARRRRYRRPVRAFGQAAAVRRQRRDAASARITHEADDRAQRSTAPWRRSPSITVPISPPR